MNWLQALFHIHKFKEIKSVQVTLNVTMFFKYQTSQIGLKVLEKCSCGEYRAYLMDSSGDCEYKVPEIIFPEEFENG